MKIYKVKKYYKHGRLIVHVYLLSLANSTKMTANNEKGHIDPQNNETKKGNEIKHFNRYLEDRK